MDWGKYAKITDPKEADKVRTKILNTDITDPPPNFMEIMQHLERVAVRDIPNIQLWVRSSSGPPRNGWTDKRWTQFHKQLPTHTSKINVPIYRGTKLPWITGGHLELTENNIKKRAAHFISSFDNHSPTTVDRTMSWTKVKSIANRFAQEAKGQELVKGYTIEDGFIHIIKPSFKAVDVANTLKKLKVVKLKGSNEQTAANIEQEVLLIVGTILTPIRRKGRVLEWEIK